MPAGRPDNAATTAEWRLWLRSLDPSRPVLIAGPTASGKSAMAAATARESGGVVVNADALQVYRCWRILTARPSAEEEAALPHALYGHVPCEAGYSAGAWLRESAALLGGARPIFVGGTGLYFAALTEGLAEIPPIPPEIRAESERRLRHEGRGALVAEIDPATAARIDRLNPARVQRAWEVLRATGRGLALWQAETPPPLLPLHAAQPVLIEMSPERALDRITRRFDAMLAAGALDEVRAARAARDSARPASRAIGASELMAHLEGRLTLAEARERAIIATRQYAKRQRTWFRARMRDWPRLSV